MFKEGETSQGHNYHQINFSVYGGEPVQMNLSIKLLISHFSTVIT